MFLDFDIPHNEIERRRENIRRVWNYQEVDHIPVCFDFNYNPFGISVREELTNKEKQLRLRLHNIKKGLDVMPDDYIPGLFVNIGCVGVDVAYGSTIHWDDDPNQTPYIKGSILSKPEEVFTLRKPDVKKDGMFPMFLEWLRFFYKETGGQIPLSGMDNNGITGVAHDLFGSNNFYMTLLDNEEAMNHLLDMISDTIIDFTDECIKTVGGIDNMTSTDWFYFWCPEGKKGHVSCDTSANYGPDLFNKYDIPYNNKVMRKYGSGLLHNCGPNPSGPLYLEHSQQLAGVNLAYKYSRDDLSKLKQPYSGKGVIYLIFDNETPEEALEGWRGTMEVLAPDVISIPIVFVAEETKDVPQLYDQYLKVGKEYARRMWRTGG